MRTCLEFESDAFPPTEAEQQGQVNPGIWGHRLADYLHDELAASGFAVEAVSSEDWGWIVPLKNAEFSLWIGCGNQGAGNKFLCFISPDKPVVWKWFRKVDATARLERLASALESVLRKHPSVHELRWWAPEEQ